MIKPKLASDVKNKFQHKVVSSSSSKVMELETIPEKEDRNFLSSPPIKLKFFSKFNKTYPSTLTRITTKNFVDPDLIPLYQACKTGNSAELEDIIGKKYEHRRKTFKLVNTLDEQLLTPLHHATVNQNLDIMAFLLSKGANINAVGGKLNRTALLMAVNSNQYEAVRHLLDENADIFAKDSNYQHVLHLAAQQGNIPITRLILGHLKQFDLSLLNTCDNEEMVPLHYAADHCHLEICQLLIQHGSEISLQAEDGSTPLHLAAYRKQIHISKFLLSVATKHKNNHFVDIRDNDGKTALYIAIEMNHYEMIKLCLDHGASPIQIQDMENLMFQQGKTKPMLHLAANNGNIDIAKLLLNHGTKIDSLDEDNYTAMHYAALGNHADMITFLHEQYENIRDFKLEKDRNNYITIQQKGYIEVSCKLLNLGANISVVDTEKRTCLHFAIYSPDTNILQMLLKNGAASLINNQDSEGYTPFLASVRNRDSKVMNLLLDHGANAATLNKNGDNFLHLSAIHNCYSKTVEVLLRCGAYVNTCDIMGNTPLHDAAEANQMAVVETLIEQKAAVNYTNRKLETPLHLACKQNALNAVKILIANHADISITNTAGHTCFNIAIENSNTEVALEMINSDNWKAVMEHRGADGYTPMKRLIEKIPEAAQAVLDRCIVQSNHSETHPDAFITFNYEYIESSPEKIELKEVQDNYLAISSMVEYNRDSLLCHPLIMAYRMDKWKNGIGATFYFQILLYIILISAYVVTMGIDLLCNSPNATNNSYLDCKTVPPGVVEAAPILVLTFGAIVFTTHSIHFYLRPMEALKSSSVNIAETMIGFCSVIFGILSLVFGSNIINSQTGALLIFASLMVIIVQLQRTSLLGNYILMFLTVLKTVCKVMVLVFMILIIFGVSFQFAFNAAEVTPFNELIRSALSIIVMFLGEINFFEIFEPKLRGLPAAHLIAIGLLLIAFIVLLNVTLTNLLTALAVGDINELQQTAKTNGIIHALVLIDEVNKHSLTFLRKKLYKPLSVYRIQGPKGKFRNYLWSSMSESAALVKCTQDRFSTIRNKNRPLSKLQSNDEGIACNDVHAKLNESISELKQMIDNLKAKFDALARP
ncbi:Transient receptor potential cation channel subfamily A member 1 [Trichoplax sp. H2]|nr:Transient receptor potential cation channel subfamily A member 1 [Trichoplax sp. H2]|eukprot:RDD41572.1 Transient receptor potential cation channel subfamily A member 1 [Trichoplax sp. H2]